MRRLQDSKAVYAQSSDIKSRTYLEYRRDMKKKAIAELEAREWLQDKFNELYKTDDAKVAKSGGDRHIWFLRHGGTLSGDPDYKVFVNNSEYNLEFQYTDRDDLDFYDFKISKVGRKKKGERLPHKDRRFVYIIKPSNQFAIFDPEWIMKEGREESVPAWGSRPAFRIPANSFKSIFQTDENLVPLIESINKKNQLLEIQFFFINREKEKFSHELQKVVDREEIFKIIPETLEGFYKSCFILDSIDRYPDNLPLWLVYGASFYSQDLNSYEFSQLMYSLDFLYGRASSLAENELKVLVETMEKSSSYIEEIQRKKLKTSVNLSPKEEIVNFLFAVNLYEDLAQELRYLEEVESLSPINKIFQSVNDMDYVLAVWNSE